MKRGLQKYIFLLASFVLLGLAQHVQAQNRQVTGKVSDSETGEGFPGVSILEVGTSNGTVTDLNGNYSLTVGSATSKVSFSFIGYQTQELEVGSRSVMDISLVLDTQQLEELVVIGYTSQSKRDLTGAVSTVSPKDFARVPAVNPLEALQARTTGLQITSNNGLPGSGASVQIRGIQSNSTSASANAPIYVVDGVITNNIDGIAPVDIEYVSVLKDASAAAIYGARAANGVIIIQTKRGTSTAAPEISFSTFSGMQGQSNMRLEVLNSEDWLEIFTEAYENTGIDVATLWDATDLAEYQGVDTDWLSLMRQTGVIQNYNLGVSGSSDASNYYVSASYLDNKGVVVGTDYNRFTLRFNSDHRIGDRIRFGNSLNINASEGNGNQGEFELAARKVPLTRAFEDNGDWGRVRNTTLEHQHQNPLWRARNVVDNREFKDLLGNLYLTVKIIEGLEFTARGNVEWKHRYDTDFSPAVDPLFQWEGSTRNLISKRQTQNMHWISDFLLDYNKSFGGNHTIKALAGYSLEENTFESLAASGSGTPNNDIRYLRASDPASRLVPDQYDGEANGYADWSFISMFGRINYDFKGKYLLTATVRRDGSSRLAEGNRIGVFPSISAAWRLSDEAFMSGIGPITDMKIRASYGVLGNVLALDEYATVAALDSRNIVLNQVPTQGYSLAAAINQDIRWESTAKKDIGIDASFFSDRLYTTLDYFVENTRDLLFPQPVAPSTGLSGSPFINAGEIKNTGFEAIVGFRQTSGDWRYDVNVNLTRVKNEVVDLDGRDLRAQGTVEGFPIRSFFGYETNGLVRNAGDLDAPHQAGVDIGDIWIKDINGFDEEGDLTGQPDGIIDAADRALIGNKYPKLYYGVMGTVGYKKLTLQLQLQGVHGVDKNILGGGQGVYHYYTAWAMGSHSLLLDRFHPTANPNGTLPRVNIGDSGQNRRFSDFWLDDASFLRIKNVNINYDLSDVVKAMKGLNVYFSINNLHTFTDFAGGDVDTTAGDDLGGSDDPNVVVGQPRTFTWGLNVTF